MLGGVSTGHSPGAELPIHSFHGKHLGIEVFANPLPHFCISRIVGGSGELPGCRDSHEHPTVLRRTRLLSVHLRALSVSCDLLISGYAPQRPYSHEKRGRLPRDRAGQSSLYRCRSQRHGGRGSVDPSEDALPILGVRGVIELPS